MPELPEVETVTRHLEKLVVGSVISSAHLIRARLAPHDAAEEFAERLAMARIEAVERRGKHILFRLQNDLTLVVHLRMSGRFILADHEADEPKFTHARFLFNNGKKLLFQDQRHFGYMRLAETDQVPMLKEIARLAPEPFSADFSPEYLYSTARRSVRPIKEFLLDQTKVCGVGNIYASESLFLSGIKPTKKANAITRPKAAILYQAILEVLSETIEIGRAMQVDPSNIGGDIYGGSDGNWRVYGREGEPCPKCERPIFRIAQAGRSTFYCRSCQR